MTQNLFDVKGRVLVMTGACGVLGSTIVKYFAAQGCKVVLLGRSAEKGERLVEEISLSGGEACFLTANVLDRDVLESNYEQIIKKYGRNFRFSAYFMEIRKSIIAFALRRIIISKTNP